MKDRYLIIKLYFFIIILFVKNTSNQFDGSFYINIERLIYINPRLKKKFY